MRKKRVADEADHMTNPWKECCFCTYECRYKLGWNIIFGNEESESTIHVKLDLGYLNFLGIEFAVLEYHLPVIKWSQIHFILAIENC